MKLFLSKHQKLVLQCYPAGKGADKKANGSELSYLLYYASTRRVKLEKVMIFLLAKTRSDVNHYRTGNLQVTLEILKALIDKCCDSLNVFATDVCNLLLDIFKLADYQLTKSILSVYGELTKNLDSKLFDGDKQFVATFTVLSESLINIKIVEGPNKMEWKMISLLAIEYVSNCIYYNLKLGNHLVSICLPPLIDVIYKNVPEKDLIQFLQTNINTEDEGNLNKVLSRIAPDEKSVFLQFQNDSVKGKHLIDQTYICLKSLFNTTLSNQISDLCNQIVKHNSKLDYELVWGSTFLELCITWIPVQLRFISLTTLLAHLSNLSRNFSKSSNNYDLQLIYANYILALISSEVNMIGLSISDVIQQLLNLQSNLILYQADHLSEDLLKELSLVYSDCICNLSTHIYYFDQVPDSIQEIYLKIDTIFEISKDSRHNAKLSGLIITFLEDILDIFTILKKNSSAISRNYVQLETWELSLPFISLNTKDYKFTHDQIAKIQEKYLEVFDEFINHELTASNEKENSAESSTHSITTADRNYNHAKISNDAKIFLEPDFNQYITLGDNFVNHFLIHVDKFLHNQPDHATCEIMMDVIVDLCYTLGINFIANFVPFFFHWTLPLDGKQPNKLQLTFAYTILYYAIKVLDSKYPSLNGYAGNSKLSQFIVQDIQTRKNNKQWEFGLDSETGSKDKTVSDANEGISLLVNKSSLSEFIAGSDYLSQWLNPDFPLVLDLLSGKNANKRNTLEIADDASQYSLSYRHFQQNGKSSYGLGSTHDISSIHSGINGNGPAFLRSPLPPLPNANGHGNYTTVSNEARVNNSPRVSDLKGLFKEPKGSLIKFGNSFETASENEKKVIDVNDILDDLIEEDDKKIIV